MRDWKCPVCGHRIEDVPVDVQEYECPKCKGKMEKVWSAPIATIFRGNGWTPIFHTT